MPCRAAGVRSRRARQGPRVVDPGSARRDERGAVGIDLGGVVTSASGVGGRLRRGAPCPPWRRSSTRCRAWNGDQLVERKPRVEPRVPARFVADDDRDRYPQVDLLRAASRRRRPRRPGVHRRRRAPPSPSSRVHPPDLITKHAPGQRLVRPSDCTGVDRIAPEDDYRGARSGRARINLPALPGSCDERATTHRSTPPSAAGPTGAAHATRRPSRGVVVRADLVTTPAAVPARRYRPAAHVPQSPWRRPASAPTNYLDQRDALVGAACGA